MNILPLQAVFCLRFSLVGPVTYGKDTQTTQVLRDVEDATNHRVSRRTIIKATSTHLDPTGAQSQFLSLILHGDGSDGTILHPTVVLQGITQDDDGHRRTLQELTAHILRIRQFLDVHLIIDHHELPIALALRGRRHESSTED